MLVFSLRVYINRCIFSNCSAKHGRLIDKYMSLLFEEIPLSRKLEFCRSNQDQIRNQRPRLRRNTIYLDRQAGG